MKAHHARIYHPSAQEQEAIRTAIGAELAGVADRMTEEMHLPPMTTFVTMLGVIVSDLNRLSPNALENYLDSLVAEIRNPADAKRQQERRTEAVIAIHDAFNFYACGAEGSA